MADYINNVAAGDAYTDACTLGPNFDARAVVLTIANNPALMQFALGKPGSWRWTDEREFYSIPQAFRVGNVIGVKVRNANPGQVARVLATLAGDDDPDFQSGMPFTAVLAASGQVTSGGGLELTFGEFVASLTPIQVPQAGGQQQLLAGSVQSDGSSQLFVELYVPQVVEQARVDGTKWGIDIWLDGINIGTLALQDEWGGSATDAEFPLYAKGLIHAPDAGLHTLELRGWTVGGTILLQAGAGGVDALRSGWWRVTTR